ncbi:hypothetical protein D3C84_802800 [compost metagenome]
MFNTNSAKRYSIISVPESWKLDALLTVGLDILRIKAGLATSLPILYATPVVAFVDQRYAQTVGAAAVVKLLL